MVPIPRVRRAAPSEHPPSEHPPSEHSAQDQHGLAAITLALFFAGVVTFALLYTPQPLLPLLSRKFHVTAATATLSISATTIALGFSMIIAGAVSDRHGRTPVITTSLVAASAFGIAVAAAPNWTMLLLLRLCEGVALAGVPAVAMAYLREEVAPTAHARATGLYIGGTALGGLVGRIASGLLADLGGWRLATGGLGALGLLGALTVIVTLPASRHFHQHHTGRAAFSRVLLVPQMLTVYAIGGLMMGAFVAVYNALSFRLSVPPYALRTGEASLVFLVYPIGALTSSLAGTFVSRFGRGPTVIAASLVTAAGIAITAASPLFLVVIGVAVMTGGFFAAHGVASGWVTARAHRVGAPVAVAASLYLFSYYLGSSIFGSLAGSVWSDHGWTGVLILTISLVLASVLVTALADRYSPSATTVVDREK